MRTKDRNENIHDVIARVVEDFPGEQSVELAAKVAGEVSTTVLCEYAKVWLERDISDRRRRRARELERESRLGGKSPAPSTTELRSRAAELLDEYTTQISVDWTAKLRASTFATGDGLTVPWGKATVEQHEQRIALLARNARGNLDGIRTHEAAVRALRDSGAGTLDEMIRKMGPRR